MNKKELIKRLSDLPDSLDVEVAIKGRNNDGKYLRRIVMDVQCRHDNKKGKDIISLICLKSLKEEYELINEASKGIKDIIKQAKRLYAQQEEIKDTHTKSNEEMRPGTAYFNDFDKFGDLGDIDDFFGCNVDKNNSVQNTITKKNNKRIKKEHLINNDETNLNDD